MSEARSQPAASGERRIQDFLSVLHRAGLEPTATELADMLWLAVHLTPTPTASPTAARHAKQPQLDEVDTLPQQREAPPPLPPRRGLSRSRSAPRQAALYPRTGGHGGTVARPFRAPAVPMLPDALALGRALRPLHHKVPSRTRYVLDEEATVERIAEHRMVRQSFWELVRTRAPERWFDLALVLDQGSSMLIWQPLLADLRRLLMYNGAFRTVRTWYLETDGDDVRLRAGTNPQVSRFCKPEELLAPDGRRLFLVVSDCISRAWHTGSVNRILRKWSTLSPLAVLHMLPPRMWPGTVLGRGMETRFVAHESGLPNSRLSPDNADFWALDENGEADIALLDHTLKLPVLSLEPDVLRGWANLLQGIQHAWVAGAVFTDATRYAVAGTTLSVTQPDAVAIDKRLQRFFAQASPLAQRLAGYLAAAPLTVSVMRLVQRVMLPRSGQIHLAKSL